MAAEGQEPDYIFKILLVGDAGVGKSSLMRRFSDDTYSDGNFSTIGVDFRIRTIHVEDKVIKLQIWDTAGHERFRSVTYSYYRGAHGIILVYDITNKESFNSMSKWLEDVRKYAQINVSLLLVGNKCDLLDGRQVDQTAGQIFGKENEMGFIEASAKNAENVQKAFYLLSTTIKNRLLAKSAAEANTQPSGVISFVPAETTKPAKKSSCC